MRREEIKAGRAAVETRVIDPLRAMGLRKQKRQSAADLEAMFERLRARLSYLSADALEALREAVLRLAGGARRNLWPDEATIYAVARQIEPPPVTHSPMVVSYMRSAAGRAAWDRDEFEAAALLCYLKRGGVPREHSWRVITEDAAERRERIERAELYDPKRAEALRLEWQAERATVERLVRGEYGLEGA